MKTRLSPEQALEIVNYTGIWCCDEPPHSEGAELAGGSDSGSKAGVGTERSVGTEIESLPVPRARVLRRWGGSEWARGWLNPGFPISHWTLWANPAAPGSHTLCQVSTG